MATLSILIPARNEEFLARTVQDLLDNIEGDTEILVGMDGYWADPGIPDDNRVKILHVSESIGQRAMQNRLAKMSTAKYVAKTDAHCAFDKGFDVKLMNRMEDDITMVPVMRNLHVFNWVCNFCDATYYQGPSLDACNECQSKDFRREIVWIAKNNPQSSAYRFNKNLQFKYFPELRAKLPREGLQESMSLQGSFFMCTRQKYWDLNLCDESWGSWGQQGSEVALKTWLSGGRVLCNFDTWYAHLFRTQKDFSFPYPMSGKSQDRARRISRDIFLNDKWEQAIHPLNWLIDKFWFALKDVRDEEAKWTEADIKPVDKGVTKGILFFTDNELPTKYAIPVQRQIKKIANELDMELVVSSRKPMWGKNVVTKEPRGYLTMFKQILKGLEAMESEIVFMAEHDVIYPKEHFTEFTPEPGTFAYDKNWWKIHSDGFCVHWDAEQVSGLCAYKKDLIGYYQWRIATFDKDNFDRKFEPYKDNQAVTWKASRPHIDIRHGRNLTYNKRSIKDFRKKETAKSLTETNIKDIPGWENSELLKTIFR